MKPSPGWRVVNEEVICLVALDEPVNPGVVEPLTYCGASFFSCLTTTPTKKPRVDTPRPLLQEQKKKDADAARSLSAPGPPEVRKR